MGKKKNTEEESVPKKSKLEIEAKKEVKAKKNKKKNEQTEEKNKKPKESTKEIELILPSKKAPLDSIPAKKNPSLKTPANKTESKKTPRPENSNTKGSSLESKNNPSLKTPAKETVSSFTKLPKKNETKQIPEKKLLDSTDDISAKRETTTQVANINSPKNKPPTGKQDQRLTPEKLGGNDIYWKVDKPAENVEGFLRFNQTKTLEFSGKLPVHIDFFGLVNELQSFIKSTDIEETMTILLDIPGMGKTTTCQMAAKASGAIYARFNCTANLIDHIHDEMEELGQESLSVAVFEKQLQSIALAGLAFLFDKIREKLQAGNKLDLGTIIDNGFKYEDLPALDSQTTNSRKENLKKAETALQRLEMTAKKGKSKFLLLHFDECQGWAINAKKKFKRKRGQEVVSKEEFSDYHLIALSTALSLLTKGSFLKVMFSGTNINVQQSIRFASDVKFYELKRRLRQTSIEEVEEVLKIFLRMDRIDEDKRKKIYKQLVGPFRILEYFLDIAYKDQTPNESKVDQYVKSTFKIWTLKIGNAYSAIGVPTDFCNELLLLFAFGEQLGGEYSEDHDSITLPTGKVSSQITQWSNSGIIRIQQTEDGLLEIFFPYHFLLEYLKIKVSMITPKAVDELFGHIRYGWTTASKSKGYCLQFALGLELATPGSKLLQHILGMISKKAIPKPFTMLTFFKSDNEAVAALKKNQIAISVDPTNEKKTGDLAFKVLLDGKELKVRGEIKNATQQDYLFKGYEEFVKKAAEKGGVNVVAFISFDKLESKTTKYKKERKSIKETIEAHPEKKFILVELEDAPTTLDLKFLSTPDQNITLRQLTENFCRSNSSFYAQTIPSVLEFQPLKFTNIDVGGVVRGECIICKKEDLYCASYRAINGERCKTCEHTAASHELLEKKEDDVSETLEKKENPKRQRDEETEVSVKKTKKTKIGGESV